MINYKLATLVYCIKGLLESGDYTSSEHIEVLKEELYTTDLFPKTVIKYENKIAEIVITDNELNRFAIFQGQKISRVQFTSNDVAKLSSLGIEKLFEIRVLDNLLKAA